MLSSIKMYNHWALGNSEEKQAIHQSIGGTTFDKQQWSLQGAVSGLQYPNHGFLNELPSFFQY